MFQFIIRFVSDAIMQSCILSILGSMYTIFNKLCCTYLRDALLSVFSITKVIILMRTEMVKDCSLLGCNSPCHISLWAILNDHRGLRSFRIHILNCPKWMESNLNVLNSCMKMQADFQLCPKSVSFRETPRATELRGVVSTFNVGI